MIIEFPLTESALVDHLIAAVIDSSKRKDELLQAFGSALFPATEQREVWPFVLKHAGRPMDLRDALPVELREYVGSILKSPPLFTRDGECGAACGFLMRRPDHG